MRSVYVALIKMLSYFIFQEKILLEVIIYFSPPNLHFIHKVFISVLRAGKGSRNLCTYQCKAGGEGGGGGGAGHRVGI